MRKLATIQLIESLTPIEGADRIEKCMMKNLGWECVVNKDKFVVGQHISYIEIDSVLPELPEYEFLRPRNFTIKTMKFKNQISQGLILPISQDLLSKLHGYIYVGMDVTNLLGIKKALTSSENELLHLMKGKKHWTKNNPITKWLWKYEWFAKIILKYKMFEPIPHNIEKTDLERIQNIPNILNEYPNADVYVTEKINGETFMSTNNRGNKFKVYGNEVSIEYKDTLHYQTALKYRLNDIGNENKSLVIQGEIVGKDGMYKLSEPKIFVFSIIDVEKKYHYDLDEIIDFCLKNKLEHAPYLINHRKTGTTLDFKLSELGTTVEELVEFSKGKSKVNPKIEREGIVVTCIDNGKKIFSFKVINPVHLLKYDK